MCLSFDVFKPRVGAVTILKIVRHMLPTQYALDVKGTFAPSLLFLSPDVQHKSHLLIAQLSY